MNQARPITLEEASDPLERLHALCTILNAAEAEAWRSIFRNLVLEWLRYPSLKAMLRRNKTGLWNDLASMVKHELRPSDVDRGARVVYEVVERPIGPRAYQPDAARREAIRNFAFLVFDEQCNKLAGPCARCGRFFVKSRSDHGKYCDGGCASSASAAVVMARKRREQRNEQLAGAQRAAAEWADSSSSLDWKEFVAQKLGCTRRWVTIAVTKYGLREPRKGENYGAH